MGLVAVTVGLLFATPSGGKIGVVWTIMASIATLYHGFNALSDEGIAHEVVDIEVPTSQKEIRGPTARLRELEKLHAEGLVTEAEYGEQRQRILGSL